MDLKPRFYTALIDLAVNISAKESFSIQNCFPLFAMKVFARYVRIYGISD